MLSFIRDSWGAIWELGKEDPRRVTHSIKVGVALTLASLVCLLEPLSEGIGQNAIWTVMTVVVVLEFTIGATLCKGLNRGAGTVLAGLFAFFVEEFANDRPVARAVFIGSAVFLTGAVATYMRFFPNIKKSYDYGVVIFILTFNLVLVSSYKVDNVTKMARDRFYTIAIGVGICLSMSLFFFPSWAGDDLHNSTLLKLQELAESVESCVNQYFDHSDEKELEDRIDTRYTKVLDSKSTDESLALYATWEPRHSTLCCRSPWQQYVKLGAALRHFGYAVVALHGCLRTEIKTPSKIRSLFRTECTRLSNEVSKVLMELANSLKSRCHFSPSILSGDLQNILLDLNTSLKSQPQLLFRGNQNTDGSSMLPEEKSVAEKVLSVANGVEFWEALPLAAFVSLLVEMVARLGLVVEEAKELAEISRFKEFEPSDVEFTVKCEQPKADPFQTHLPSSGAE